MVKLATDLRQRHNLKGRAALASRLHLSLNFVGTFRGPPTRAVMEKARALADKVTEPAFRVTLNRIESWKGNRCPLLLCGEAGALSAERLHRALHKALAAGNMAPRRMAEFFPHLSLLWDEAMVPSEIVEPISWMVRDFVLLDCPEGEGRHEVIGRWPLAS